MKSVHYQAFFFFTPDYEEETLFSRHFKFLFYFFFTMFMPETHFIKLYLQHFFFVLWYDFINVNNVSYKEVPAVLLSI